MGSSHLHTQGSLGRHRCAQHVASGQMAQAVLVLRGPFPSASQCVRDKRLPAVSHTAHSDLVGVRGASTQAHLDLRRLRALAGARGTCVTTRVRRTRQRSLRNYARLVQRQLDGSRSPPPTSIVPVSHPLACLSPFRPFDHLSCASSLLEWRPHALFAP